MRVRLIGHNTFLFETTSGLRFLTDPWFAKVGVFRAVPAAVPPQEIGKLDFVLPSHNHIDHLDGAGLALAHDTRAVVVGSPKVAARARKAGCEAVGLRVGEQFSRGDFAVTAVPADHPCTGIFGDWRPIGFLICTEGLTIYFSGDTRDHARLRSALAAAGPLDAAFLQIACAWYFTDDGLRTDTAAALAKYLRPGVSIPMHYHGRGRQANPQNFVDRLTADGLQAKVAVDGEWFELKPMRRDPC